ncbi:MAG: hypothetical protein HQM08_25020 [Candidatus Riflebacteria bacterium]|nr:hypothetical protein [Candidatus Riflebacteria bacterium]
MNKDPIVEEIHKTRLKLEKECEERGESYFDYLMRTQNKYKSRLVSRVDDSKDKKIKLKKAV